MYIGTWFHPYVYCLMRFSSVRSIFVVSCLYVKGDRGSTVVKVLRYESEVRWFDPGWCHNTSDRTMALGSTQPLTEMSTRSKCGRCVRLTNLSQSCAVVMKSENLNFLEPSGPIQAWNGTALSFMCFLPRFPKYCTFYFLLLIFSFDNSHTPTSTIDNNLKSKQRSASV
jgi:hypothetical protein